MRRFLSYGSLPHLQRGQHLELKEKEQDAVGSSARRRVWFHWKPRATDAREGNTREFAPLCSQV